MENISTPKGDVVVDGCSSDAAVAPGLTAINKATNSDNQLHQLSRTPSVNVVKTQTKHYISGTSAHLFRAPLGSPLTLTRVSHNNTKNTEQFIF